MNFLFNPPDIDILLSDVKERKIVEVKVDENGKREKLALFYDGENISGKVHFTLRNNKSFEHNGIKIEFIGVIQFFNDRNSSMEFITLSKELSRPGELSHSNSYPFEFREVEKPYESYYGCSVKLKYLLKVTMNKLLGNITKELGIAVHAMSLYPNPSAPDPNLRTEVGIEDSLHIEFEYDKPRYHLKDVIVGKVYFLVIRLKIKSMEIELLRKETTGASLGVSSGGYSGAVMERNECVLKYEVMDGSPNRGETVPIRIFLAGYDLQPSMRDIAKKFSVRYFLNLVLVDEDDRRYYKTREIHLWRKYDKYYRKFKLQETEVPRSSSMTASLKSSSRDFPPSSATPCGFMGVSDPSANQKVNGPNHTTYPTQQDSIAIQSARIETFEEEKLEAAEETKANPTDRSPHANGSDTCANSSSDGSSTQA